ncbi:MAG: outer membrane protein assembly factor BamE [Methylotenera sp.]|nr:outer membrane protein assembly factor BamE [Oligoflexia bacterium]
MKTFLSLFLVSIMATGCATGVGRKMSQDELDSVKEGHTTKNEVRKMFGAPMAQLNREGLECDSYTYSGMVNYVVFTKQDKAQSYNFCYDKGQIVQKKDGIQM